MREIWLPVKGYSGHYSVSNTGKVRRDKGVIVDKNGFIREMEERLLTPFKRSNKDYLSVSLQIKKKKKNFYIHRLVVDAFVGIPEGKIINHIDCDPTNNSLENLEV